MDGVAVSGEIYEMADKMVDVLDSFEGVEEGLYRRGPIALEGSYADALVMAYFYEQSVDGLRDCDTQWPS